jgi:hypothetical protein
VHPDEVRIFLDCDFRATGQPAESGRHDFHCSGSPYLWISALGRSASGGFLSRGSGHLLRVLNQSELKDSQNENHQGGSNKRHLERGRSAFVFHLSENSREHLRDSTEQRRDRIEEDLERTEDHQNCKCPDNYVLHISLTRVGATKLHQAVEESSSHLYLTSSSLCYLE